MKLPLITVILPVRQEGVEITRTIDSVLCQDYPKEKMEVLVVDGMSTDETRETVQAIAARDHRVRLLDNPAKIVPTAMNIGTEAARGEIIIRVDGHTTIARNYVKRCVKVLAQTGAGCVGGRMDPTGTTFTGQLVALATCSPFGVGNSQFHYSDKPGYTESVYMGAWYRDQLMGAGGFDEEMVRNQDDELSYRLRRLGRRVYLEPGLRSEYRPRGDGWKLWRQYFQYGFWKVRILQKHPGMMRSRHFIPSIFVLVGTTATISALFSSYAAWGLLAGVVLYFTLGLIAALRSRGGLLQRSLLPLVFFALHSSYGAGFLAGQVRFAGKWRLREASRFDEGANISAPVVD